MQHGVVLILADDMGADLSCLGTKGIQTPAVDGRACQGVLFNEAEERPFYIQVNVNTPQRAKASPYHAGTKLNSIKKSC